MEQLKLINTETLMKRKAENKDFDSYAVFVKVGNRERTILSGGVNEDTYFDIASCGKVLVTSPLILQAIDKKLLSLNDTLDKFFDSVPDDKKGITIKHLLTHTSGIERHNYSQGLVGKDSTEVAKEILARPKAFKEGENYIYSCSGMILLGYILEKIYNDTLENLFDKYLKKPLGLNRSKFNIEINEPNSALCYRSKTVYGLAHPWDDENVRILQTSAGSGGQFFTLADIKKFA